MTLGIILAVLALAGCGGGGGSFTVRGTIDNGARFSVDNPTSSNTWTVLTTNPDQLGGKCADSETIDVMATVGGRSVAVASGTTASHGQWAGFPGSGGICHSAFTVTGVPGGHDSYGVKVEGVPGEVNYTTAQLGKHISLSIGGGG